MALTEKQKRFVDFFIETGNQAEAARLAGYKQPNVQGAQNYAKLRSYIDAKLAEKDNQRIASQDEVLQYLTSVMRGEVTEECIVVEGTGVGFSEARNIRKEVSPKDRNKAAELLGKRYNLFSGNGEVAEGGNPMAPFVTMFEAARKQFEREGPKE